MSELSAPLAAGPCERLPATAPPAPARTGAGRPGSVCARLWEAIERTRRELESWQSRVERIGERFATTIRPREEGFTRSVCHVTERLVQHHERTPLACDERSLLGLWIDENLESLSSHPFAPRAELDALACRWQRHLRRADDPLDAALASLNARRATPPPTPSGFAAPGGAGEGPPNERHESGSAAAGADASRERRSGDGGRDRGAAVASAPDARLEELVGRLFRRLARVLHPDRERDETRRALKHRLMSECLAARDARDLDALLRLHAAHVGELPPDIAGDDAALARLLREQLALLQRRLRRARRPDDALERLIVERYGAEDAAASERRFVSHARALDREIDRFEDLAELIGSAEGLREALVGRRGIELDRLAIAELTGATS